MESNNKYNSPVKATLTGIASLFKQGERVGVLSENDRLEGKKVLVTGSSSGLGLATAKQIASLGAKVIMAVRSGIPKKGEEVKKVSSSAKVSMNYVDLADFDSIKNFVSEIKTQYENIDVLVCNAGMVASKARKTKKGLEEMFMVNYLSTYYLVRLMLEQQLFNKEGGELPRIIIVNSESHRDPKQFNWSSFGKFEPYTMGKTVQLYGYYKLLLATFARELSRRVNQDEITYSVFVLCPGPVNSNIAREAPAIFKPLLRLVFRIFFSSPLKASEPVVYLSTSKDVEAKAFDYLFLMQRKELDKKAVDQANGKKLWALSENLIREVGVRI
jgi:NAD(P)-dependent dehydrogenase (short-subunit alcohol dehydrogenase family)